MYRMLSEVFWSLVVSSSIMFVMGIAKLISKSRCDQVECMGCFRVHRMVELENQESKCTENKENSI